MIEETCLVLNTDYMLYKNQDDGQFHLLNTVEGNGFELNESSYDFLQCCNGSTSVKEIFEHLSQLYNINQETLGKDFDPLIEEWLKMEIIKKK